MKLIKINTDHYVVVDDSEIKMDDWYLDDTNTVRQAITEAESYWTHRKHYKKVTHSTQPDKGMENVSFISPTEVKELIDEVDVEKKANKEYKDNLHNPFFTAAPMGYIKGYNQALEDNKDKKYTEEDLKYLLNLLTYDDLAEDEKIESCVKYIKDLLQPKTEWEVCFIDGKLKLK